MKRIFSLTLAMMFAFSLFIQCYALTLSELPISAGNYLSYLFSLVEIEGNLPDDFATAEELKAIGKFEYFYGHKDIGQYRDLRWGYQYVLRDNSGQLFDFVISHNDHNKDKIVEVRAMPDDMTDLSRIEPENMWVILEKDGIFYSYEVNTGELDSVEWFAGNNRYYLSMQEQGERINRETAPYLYTAGNVLSDSIALYELNNANLGDYPATNKNTFAKKLLNAETSTQAINELTETINKKNTPIWVLLLIECIKISAAVALAVVAVIFSVKKIRSARRKGAPTPAGAQG